MLTTDLMIWASAHRAMVILVIGLSMWVAAYAWYFKGDWDLYWRERRPHKWSVDLENKTTKGGRRRVD
jgi:hypothetical protein